MNSELVDLVNSIKSVALNDELSDSAVAALSRCYISMQNLVVANALEADYGSRKQFENALDVLYRICVERCGTNQPFARRSRVIPVLYMNAYMQMRGVELRKSQECHQYMYDLVDEWRKHYGYDNLYGVLYCISNLFCWVIDEDRSDDKDFRLFKHTVDEWAASLGDDGLWRGVPTAEALCRIDLMIRNSNMFLDPACDTVIENALRAYCKSVLEGLGSSDSSSTTRNDAFTLFMLCEVLVNGIGLTDFESVDAVARTAAAQMRHYPQGSEEWLWYAAVSVLSHSMKINDIIKQQVLAHSA